MVNLVDALIVLTALLAVTLGVGAFARWRQGRPQRQIPNEVVDPQRLGAERLGDTATLLQFSTEMCARCPGVHRSLSSLAGDRDGVLHLDVDLTHRPDIAKHFQIMQTPTTLILDGDGVIRTRIGGVPHRRVVELELARLTGESARA